MATSKPTTKNTTKRTTQKTPAPLMRVMTIVGTRPELIRLSRVIAKLDASCEHILVHTGQNYDYTLNAVFFKELGIRRPDVVLSVADAGKPQSAAHVIGQTLIQVDAVLAEYQPEAVLILGDTNSAMSAISAKRRKIPVFHMEAGNRCFDQRVPEEINRRIIDHVSDINLPYSSIAREYLLREGFPPDQIIKIGSPMREVLKHYATQISRSKVLKTLGLAPRNYFVVSAHREENVDSPEQLERFITMLTGLAKHYGQPIIVSTHPRTRERLAKKKWRPPAQIHLVEPFGFFDYIQLQTQAHCVLSDSGTITEESSILNFPALNLRDVQERPEGFEEAAVMLVGLDLKRILQGIALLDEQGRGPNRTLAMVADYAPDNVAEKIIRIIQSHTDFINRRTWKIS